MSKCQWWCELSCGVHVAMENIMFKQTCTVECRYFKRFIKTMYCVGLYGQFMDARLKYTIHRKVPITDKTKQKCHYFVFYIQMKSPIRSTPV